MSESILFDLTGNVATLTFNRPDKLNSFNVAMHQRMSALLDELEQPDSSARVLVITGSGRAFCAGQDLSDRHVSANSEAPDLGESLEQWYNPMIARLKALPLPVVCAVNGVAAGAGANIALACDLVMAARSASFVQAFCRLGLVPDSGGTWHLPRAVGTPRAMGLAMLGDKISAEQAASWGMIWQVVNDDALPENVRTLAEHLARQPTSGLAKIKHAIYASANHTLEEQMALECSLQREAGKSSDYREGVAAFMEKRSPNFSGK